MGVRREKASDEYMGLLILFSPLLYVLNSSKVKFRDSPHSPVAKTVLSMQRDQFNPWSGNLSPHAASIRSRKPQLRPNTAK